jgi:hypothetical protein
MPSAGIIHVIQDGRRVRLMFRLARIGGWCVIGGFPTQRARIDHERIVRIRSTAGLFD